MFDAQDSDQIRPVQHTIPQPTLGCGRIPQGHPLSCSANIASKDEKTEFARFWLAGSHILICLAVNSQNHPDGSAFFVNDRLIHSTLFCPQMTTTKITTTGRTAIIMKIMTAQMEIIMKITTTGRTAIIMLIK